MRRILTLLALLAFAPAAFAQAAPEGTSEAIAAPAAHGGLDPQAFNPTDALWSAGLFVVFAVVLGIFVWPKVLAALNARESKMASDLLAAEQGAKDAAAKLAELNQQLADAQKQAQKVVDEARVAAGKVAAEIKATAEREINEVKARATAEIKSAKEQAVAEIGAQVAEVATAVASKILAREISASDQQALVASALREVSAKN